MCLFFSCFVEIYILLLVLFVLPLNSVSIFVTLFPLHSCLASRRVPLRAQTAAIQ